MAGNSDVLAIGDIIMSTLGEADFVNEHGGPYPVGSQTSWVPCDGRNVSGSAYANKTGLLCVPDLVGRYPRGADIRGKTGVITAGTGQTMEDTLLSHVHSYHAFKAEADGGTGFVGSDFNSNSGGQNDGNWAKDYISSGPEQLSGRASLADETRPKTTIVNFFIRIN